MKRAALVLMCGLVLNGFAGDNFEGQATIGGVQEGDRENKAEQKVLYLKFNTHQSGKPYVGILRVMMEFAEKDSEQMFVSSAREVINMGDEVSGGQFKGNRYTGAVSWEFETEVNDLKRPKVTAYAVQYGYEKDGKFHMLKEECYRTDSYQELEERTKSSKKRPLKRVYSMWTVD